MRPSTGVFGQQVSATLTEYSIWGTGVLGTLAFDNGGAVCLGTKFRASSSGAIRGIRWQNSTDWPQAGEVALFQSTTNLSGITTVTGQTANGWQRMDFASAVSIASSTIYTAVARYTGSSAYRATSGLFTSAGVTNGPLEAVATSVSTNGLYTYSSTLVVPTNTWQGGCYFIDVIFAA